MKTVKYYYSKAIHVRYVPCITDDQGDVVFLLERNVAPAKKLPRVTVASVYNSDDNSMTFGVAICSPKDTFKKSEGRKLAYERALNSPKCTVSCIKPGKTRYVSKKYANMLIETAEANFLNLNNE
jgi:hypothetical protein